MPLKGPGNSEPKNKCEKSNSVTDKQEPHRADRRVVLLSSFSRPKWHASFVPESPRVFAPLDLAHDDDLSSPKVNLRTGDLDLVAFCRHILLLCQVPGRSGMNIVPSGFGLEDKASTCTAAGAGYQFHFLDYAGDGYLSLGIINRPSFAGTFTTLPKGRNRATSCEYYG